MKSRDPPSSVRYDTPFHKVLFPPGFIELSEEYLWTGRSLAVCGWTSIHYISVFSVFWGDHGISHYPWFRSWVIESSNNALYSKHSCLYFNPKNMPMRQLLDAGWPCLLMRDRQQVPGRLRTPSAGGPSLLNASVQVSTDTPPPPPLLQSLWRVTEELRFWPQWAYDWFRGEWSL